MDRDVPTFSKYVLPKGKSNRKGLSRAGLKGKDIVKYAIVLL